MLDIIARYYCKRFQGKRMVQTQENGEKLHFGPDSNPLSPYSGCQLLFLKIGLRQSLDIMVSYNRIKY